MGEMNELKFNSQICTTKEHSQRLLDLGLKPETADMSYYILDYEPVLTIGMAQVYRETIKGGKITSKQNAEIIPAWSLHRLIEMLPNEIPTEDYYLILGVSFNCVYYADNEYAEVFQSFDGNTYSCIIKCVEWLISEGYFNKEYLKQ